MASEELCLDCVFKVEIAEIDVIFVHGLTGDPHKTWVWEGGDQSWLIDLGSDLNKANVWTLGYPASLFVQWAKKEMNIYDRAGNVLEQLASKGVGQRPIVFVAHSLGGILVKQIVLRSKDSDDENWKSVSEAVEKIIFLATPHSGADLANVLKLVAPRLKSSHVALLSGENGELDSLSDRYRSFVNSGKIKTVAYHELYKTRGASIVVTRESADPGVMSCQVVGLDKDHVNISKPKNRDDQLYNAVRYHIQQVIDDFSCGSGDYGASAFLEDYKQRSDLDRRNLMEKLIAAGMESDYEHANDSQSKFAIRYHKYGLHDPARLEYDEVLSEVEVRFLNKIYRPLIQEGADKKEIYAAIQSEVVEYIKEKLSRNRIIDSKVVYSAMYYLTEQCYIKWDSA
ncbi:ABC-three component system protein [Thalassospira xiamenensis]|uniref:ABC-three component system protein n=1 Tax=Thalassospira xiamenensis TaxID=220697 RepID=UPI003AA9009F